MILNISFSFPQTSNDSSNSDRCCPLNIIIESTVTITVSEIFVNFNRNLRITGPVVEKRMNNILDEIRDMKRFGGGDGCKFAAE